MRSSCIARELPDRGGDVPAAVAEGAAEVDLQHGVAPVGEELRVRAVAPRVVVPRSAVHHQHEWQAAPAPQLPRSISLARVATGQSKQTLCRSGTVNSRGSAAVRLGSSASSGRLIPAAHCGDLGRGAGRLARRERLDGAAAPRDQTGQPPVRGAFSRGWAGTAGRLRGCHTVEQQCQVAAPAPVLAC